MKRYYRIPGFILFIAVSILSCSKQGFLDREGSTNLNEEETFKDSANTIAFLGDLYNVLSYLGGPREVNAMGAPLGETTDEADSRWPGGHNVPLQIIGGNFTGNWDVRNTNDWKFLFNKIRSANLYLQHVDQSPISEALKSRTKLEARFLRCWSYHQLLRGWGGVPLIADTVYGIASPNLNGRATYEDCVNYIINELDDIASGLPLVYTGIDYGRITRGACLALKARVLLYAASPLFNGGSFATSPELASETAYPTANPSRWQKALDAAQDVVNLNQYQLEVDNSVKPGGGFYNVFLKRINQEYILAWMRPFNKEIETNYLTPSRGGSFLQFPTQELVDAFPMKDGIHYSQSPLYDPSDPYANRDPRFYYTVIYNGSPYFYNNTNTYTPVYTYAGAAQDGIVAITSNAATWTGYYRRKLADSSIAGNSSANTQRCQPLIRYAEVLLNLAEAANEVGQTGKAMAQIKMIRQRAGLEPGTNNNYGLPENPTQQEVREIVRNERFIELAFEEHRYFDLRRWRIGDLYDGKSTHGMRIVRNPDGSYSYQRIEIRPRYFKVNSYLFPIPQSETTLNFSLLQNPGW